MNPFGTETINPRHFGDGDELRPRVKSTNPKLPIVALLILESAEVEEKFRSHHRDVRDDRGRPKKIRIERTVIKIKRRVADD